MKDRWGDPPHVTSPIWGPPTACKQALDIKVERVLTFAYTLDLRYIDSVLFKRVKFTLVRREKFRDSGKSP